MFSPRIVIYELRPESIVVQGCHAPSVVHGGLRSRFHQPLLNLPVKNKRENL
jgi:hypothetical protein